MPSKGKKLFTSFPEITSIHIGCAQKTLVADPFSRRGCPFEPKHVSLTELLISQTTHNMVGFDAPGKCYSSVRSISSWVMSLDYVFFSKSDAVRVLGLVYVRWSRPRRSGDRRCCRVPQNIETCVPSEMRRHTSTPSSEHPQKIWEHPFTASSRSKILAHAPLSLPRCCDMLRVWWIPISAHAERLFTSLARCFKHRL